MHLITNDQVRVAPDRCTVYRPTPSPRRWLGVWAHPDDEAYLSAGAMDHIIGSGGKVTVVALSDGEAGFPAEDRRPIAQRRQHRRRELHTAMSTIGVHDVRFLGLADGDVGSADDSTVALLAEIIDDMKPDIVATFGPDGITGHPDHVACWELTTRAWRQAGRGELWYAAKTTSWLDDWRSLHDRFGMWMTEEPTGVAETDTGLTIDLTGEQLDRKRAVLAGHRSQTSAVAEAIGEASYRAWISQETFRLPTSAELRSAECGAGAPLGRQVSAVAS